MMRGRLINLFGAGGGGITDGVLSAALDGSAGLETAVDRW